MFDDRFSFRTAGNRRDHRNEIRDIRCIQHDAGQFCGRNGHGILCFPYIGSETFQHIQDLTVSLCRIQPESRHGDGTGSDGSGAQPERRVGPVSLNGALRRHTIGALHMIGIPLLGHINPRQAHTLRGNVQITAGLDLPRHPDGPASHEWKGKEQPADKLGGNIGRNDKVRIGQSSRNGEGLRSLRRQPGTMTEQFLIQRRQRPLTESSVHHKFSFDSQSTGHRKQETKRTSGFSAVHRRKGWHRLPVHRHHLDDTVFKGDGCSHGIEAAYGSQDVF